MSTLTKICFDASYHEGCVGIGIYNFDTKEEIIERYKVNSMNSTVAETMALVKTLNYLKDKKIHSAHLFTDNMLVAEKGISKSFKKKFKSLTLTWIPREFNIDADRLSKRAHLLTPKVTDITCPKTKVQREKEKKIEMNDPIIIAEKRESRELKAQIPQLTNLKQSLKSYPLKNRINLLKKYSKSELTDKLLNSLTSGVTCLNSTDYRKCDKMFLKMYLSIIDRTECNQKAFMDVIKKNYIKKQHSNGTLNSSLCDIGGGNV